MTAGRRFRASGKAPRRDRQVVRVLAILKILQEGGRPSVHDLAARFKARRETIYRDLRVREEVGYPITGDESGRIGGRPRLAPGASVTVPPVQLTRHEAAGWQRRPLSPRARRTRAT